MYLPGAWQLLTARVYGKEISISLIPSGDLAWHLVEFRDKLADEFTLEMKHQNTRVEEVMLTSPPLGPLHSVMSPSLAPPQWISKITQASPRRESSEHLAGWYTRKKGGDQGAAPDKANQFMLFNDQSLSAVCCHMNACNSNCFTSVTSEKKKTRADPHLSAACRRHPVLRLHPKGNQQSAKWSSHWGPCPAPKKARDHHVSRSMQRHDGQGDASSPPVGNTQTVLSFMQWCPYIRSNWAETCTLFSCLMAASM